MLRRASSASSDNNNSSIDGGGDDDDDNLNPADFCSADDDYLPQSPPLLVPNELHQLSSFPISDPDLPEFGSGAANRSASQRIVLDGDQRRLATDLPVNLTGIHNTKKATIKQHYYPEGGWGWVVVATAGAVVFFAHGMQMALATMLAWQLHNGQAARVLNVAVLNHRGSVLYLFNFLANLFY